MSKQFEPGDVIIYARHQERIYFEIIQHIDKNPGMQDWYIVISRNSELEDSDLTFMSATHKDYAKLECTSFRKRDRE